MLRLASGQLVLPSSEWELSRVVDVRFPRDIFAAMRDATAAMDEGLCYRAVQSKDPRFDGWFFTAVVTTGIYCRPSCPAVTPKRRNVRFYSTAAAAQAAGFRACK